MVRIRLLEESAAAEIDALLAVAGALPEYFDEAAMARMPVDAQEHATYIAIEGDRADHLRGFAVVERKGNRVAEVLWMGVCPERRRMGIGARLLSALEDDLRAEGFELLEIKTLAAEAEYAPYEGTRRFYEKQGFLWVETVDPYPAWPPGNPCAIYVAPL